MSQNPLRPIDATTYAEVERRLADLLYTTQDLLLLQGEAILLLEAVARGLGGPGVRALNLVSGPYGPMIGDWLKAGGATVEELRVDFNQAIDPETVRAALDETRFDVVTVVHAEAATGVVNPLDAVAEVVHSAGALLVVDAVASVGAEPLALDNWAIDLTMIGLQKAPAGPSGVCALVASQRGWTQIAQNPSAPRGSILSLLDWKERWIDAGRRVLPAYAHEHEMRALIATLDELEDDRGLVRLIGRHQRARAAIRAGTRALGLELWVKPDRHAAGVATLIVPPNGVSVEALVKASSRYVADVHPGLLTAAPGSLAGSALRINHAGRGSWPEPVFAALTALAAGLHGLGLAADLNAALRAAEPFLFNE